MKEPSGSTNLIPCQKKKGNQVFNTHNINFKSDLSRLSWATSALTLGGSYSECFLILLFSNYYYPKLFNISFLIYSKTYIEYDHKKNQSQNQTLGDLVSCYSLFKRIIIVNYLQLMVNTWMDSMYYNSFERQLIFISLWHVGLHVKLLKLC